MRRSKRKITLVERHRRAQDVAKGIDIAKETVLPLFIKHTARKVFLLGVLLGTVLAAVPQWVWYA